MTGIEILLALAGVAVMSMVVGGMILITPLGEKAVHAEDTAAHGSNLSPGAISCLSSTNEAQPASTTGITLSAMHPDGSRPCSASHFQNCHSSPGIT